MSPGAVRTQVYVANYGSCVIRPIQTYRDVPAMVGKAVSSASGHLMFLPISSRSARLRPLTYLDPRLPGGRCAAERTPRIFTLVLIADRLSSIRNSPQRLQRPDEVGVVRTPGGCPTHALHTPGKPRGRSATSHPPSSIGGAPEGGRPACAILVEGIDPLLFPLAWDTRLFLAAKTLR